MLMCAIYCQFPILLKCEQQQQMSATMMSREKVDGEESAELVP